MGIVIIRQDNKIDVWKNAILANAPKTRVYSYLEEHPKDKITMALVWKHPKGILNRYPHLKCIASSGAGVDFIFNDPDGPKHIPITRVVDPMLANDMSEFIIALVFNHLKNLNLYKADQLSHNWIPKNYVRIKDVIIGIMGMGELGNHVAKSLRHIGFKVQGWANSSKTMAGIKTFVGQKELPPFLCTTNILICLLPLTERTSGILDKQLFKQLPQGAFIINVARGGHMVDSDLLEFLEKGHLSGAGLDVFHEEPLPKGHPFWNHPKIHITPHIASVTDIASVVPQILENYERLQNGQPLLHQVSFQKGY